MHQNLKRSCGIIVTGAIPSISLVCTELTLSPLSALGSHPRARAMSLYFGKSAEGYSDQRSTSIAGSTQALHQTLTESVPMMQLQRYAGGNRSTKCVTVILIWPQRRHVADLGCPSCLMIMILRTSRSLQISKCRRQTPMLEWFTFQSILMLLRR
jgi:hypothetical protein